MGNYASAIATERRYPRPAIRAGALMSRPVDRPVSRTGPQSSPSDLARPLTSSD